MQERSTEEAAVKSDDGLLAPTGNHKESKVLLQLTGQTWRLRTILIDSDSGEGKAELSPQDIRKLCHAVESLQVAIESLGIRVIDRCNEDFHPGLPDTVVTEEPREGISKERIIRTIRPTIMWGQTMMQRGEIDIAVPTKSKPKAPETATAKQELTAPNASAQPEPPTAQSKSTESQSPNS